MCEALNVSAVTALSLERQSRLIKKVLWLDSEASVPFLGLYWFSLNMGGNISKPYKS